ncbi:hypothetical protein [Herbiconiux liangxiaofengii]|uniref:hypothetical protein n=1 Tax=Herbiconiux liangxiaofengii TaxID=3342795 RepID=UPI0035BA05B8
MSDPRDDEALGWAGDDDPTLVPTSTTASTGASAKTGARAGTGAEAVPRTVLDEAEEAEDRAVERELAEAEAASAQLGSAALIALGVLGGVYLLYTIGWVIVFTRYEVASEMTFGVFSDLISRTLAVAAAPLWFVATLTLTQRRDLRYRFLWLVIGVLVLVPWPFLIGGGA